jgi:hypothetical protein
MAINWTSDSVSIVVIPQTSTLNSLRPIIQEWSEEGLLGPFLALTPDQVVSVGKEQSVIKAHTWSEVDGVIANLEIDLFEFLAQHEFRVVRLIALRVLLENGEIADSEIEVLDRISLSVQRLLPMATGAMNETQQVVRLMKINLIIAPTESHATGNEKLVKGAWDMNVVASPEDRSTPWTADAQVRDDQRFLRFVMLHLATTGGLWNGVGASPFELLSRERAKDGGKWLTRVFVNAILTDGLSRRVAAKVLDEIASATKDIYDAKIAINVPGTEIISPELVDQYVDWMVGQVFVLEDSVLSFNAPAKGEAPAKLNWLEWEQIKNFLIFSWDKLRVLPWWIWVFVRRRVGAKLTQTFQGGEGLATVGIDPNDPMDLRDRTLALKLASTKELSAEAKKSMSATSGARSGRSTPKLWSSIRRIVFGMLDGSDLTEFGITENDGRVPVFAKTSQIIFDPSDAFQIPSEYHKELRTEALSWDNLEQVDTLIQIASSKVSALRQKEDELARQISETDDQIDALQRQIRGY